MRAAVHALRSWAAPLLLRNLRGPGRRERKRTGSGAGSATNGSSGAPGAPRGRRACLGHAMLAPARLGGNGLARRHGRLRPRAADGDPARERRDEAAPRRRAAWQRPVEGSAVGTRRGGTGARNSARVPGSASGEPAPRSARRTARQGREGDVSLARRGRCPHDADRESKRGIPDQRSERGGWRQFRSGWPASS